MLSRRGSPARLLRATRNGELRIVVSRKLLTELHDVLMRPRFRPFLAESDVDAYVEEIGRLGHPVEDPTDAPPVLRDPDDDYLVALARASSAVVIITGDRDLVDHGGLEPRAMTPREAVDRYVPPSRPSSA